MGGYMSLMERVDPLSKTAIDVEKGTGVVVAAPLPSTPLLRTDSPNFFGRYVTDWSQGVTLVIFATTLFVTIYAFIQRYELIGGFAVAASTGSVVSFYREGQLGRWKNLTTQNQRLQQEITALNAQISAFGANEKTLQGELTTLKSEKDELVAASKKLEQQLTEKLTELEKLNVSLRTTEQKLESLQALVVKYQQNEAQVAQNEAALKSQIDSLNSTLSALKLEKDAIVKEVQELKSGAAQVKNANADVAGELQTIEALKKETQDLDTRYKAVTSENASYQVRLKKAESRVEALQSQLTTIFSMLEDLSSTMPQLKTILANLKETHH